MRITTNLIEKRVRGFNCWREEVEKSSEEEKVKK
jgi:hypothetical protein